MKRTSFKGVTYDHRLTTNPWQARIMRCGVTYYLGNYASDIEAGRAYREARRVFDNIDSHNRHCGVIVRQVVK